MFSTFSKDVYLLALLLIYRPDAVSDIKRFLFEAPEEEVDNYSFLRILRDATDFEEAIDVARDDLEYELEHVE